MTRRLSAVCAAALLAGALAAAPAALQAQLNTSFSVAGGLSTPVSDLNTLVDAGYNVAGAVSFGAPLSPVGVRLEVGYNSFNAKSSYFTNNGKIQILSGTANATIALGPTASSPYLIGGVGLYNRSVTEDYQPTDTKTVGGFNAGAGLRFPLGTMSTFIEARYHMMLGNAPDQSNLQFVPITFGINF